MRAIPPDDIKLTLSNSLTIKNVLASLEAILDHMDSNSTAILDIAEGAQVDLSFVQLIVAARIRAEARAGRVLLARPAGGDLYDVLKRGGFLDDMTPDDAQFWLHQEKS